MERTCPHSTCGHTWTPRKAEPKKCPQCQNPLWRSSRPKKMLTGTQMIEKYVIPACQESGVEVIEDQLMPHGASLTGNTECVRAPEEQDSLSALKARAEALMGKLE